MSKKRKIEFKGKTNLTHIAHEMLTDLYHYRTRLQHPKLQSLFDEVVQGNYDPKSARLNEAMWGTGDGSDMTPAEVALVWNRNLSEPQKARALKKLRASWRRKSDFTAEDRAFASLLKIKI